MSLDIILLLIRITIALALYAFLALLFVYIARDLRAASMEQKLRQRTPGKLVITKSEGVPMQVGQILPLSPYTSIGRGPTNTIVLPDTFASVTHAHVVFRRDQWWLEDQQSRNGTTVNDIPVKAPVVLSAGDEIGIGRVTFRFELD